MTQVPGWTDIKYHCSSEELNEDNWYQGYAEKERSDEEEYWHVSLEISLSDLKDMPRILAQASADLLTQVGEGPSA